MATQPTLFDEPPATELAADPVGVPGLTYTPELLDAATQSHIIRELDSRPWLADLKRRVQHYGYKYDYRARAIDPGMYVGPLPNFAVEVAQQLQARGLIEEPPDQLIVNEYLPGQGISAHVDCEPCFKDAIVTVSLGSVYEMDFIRVDSGEVRHVLLGLGSALVMKGDARYRWMHRIKARQSERHGPRGRRVSLTFRNVILPSLA